MPQNEKRYAYLRFFCIRKEPENETAIAMAIHIEKIRMNNNINRKSNPDKCLVLFLEAEVDLCVAVMTGKRK